jgi:hypothetical protein
MDDVMDTEPPWERWIGAVNPVNMWLSRNANRNELEGD